MKPAAPKVARTSALWIPDTGPTHDPSRGHLFIALTEPDAGGQVLLVPVCSEHPKCDSTCKLGPGDHPFVRRPSFADYHKMRLFEVSKIEEGITKGVVEYRGPFDGVAFAYICEGIEKSPKCAPKYRNYYNSRKK